MGGYREKSFAKEFKTMESMVRKENHVKVKIRGDVDEALANRIRLAIEGYNNQSDKGVSYKITCRRDHRP